jgi:hypothetical protein
MKSWLNINLNLIRKLQYFTERMLEDSFVRCYLHTYYSFGLQVLRFLFRENFWGPGRIFSFPKLCLILEFKINM